MLPRSLKKNTKCVNAADAAKLKLKLLMKNAAAAGSSVSQPVAPTTAEQRLARKNELKAHGLDQIHDRLQKLVSQLEIHSVSLSQEDVNLKFLHSLPSEFIYSFFASQSTSPQFDNKDLKQIDVDDLEEMDLRWQMAMLTMRARRFLQKTGRNLGANGTSSMGFDMSKVECYNCHRKGHFARECRSPKDQRRPEEDPANFALMAFSSSSSSDNEVPSCSKACLKAYTQLHIQYDKLTDDFCKFEFDVISYQTGLESVEARLLVYKQNESFFEENIKLLNIEVQLRDTALVTLRFGVNTAPIPVETDHLAFTVQLSPTKPEQDLSYTSRPSAPIIEERVSDFEEESEPKDPQQSIPSFAQSFEHVKTPRHFVQPIKTTFQAATSVTASPKSNSSGKRRNRTPCFVCKSVDHLIKDCDFHTKKMAKPTQRNYANRGCNKKYAPKPLKHSIPTVVLTQSKPVSNTVVRPVSTVLPYIPVTRPRHANQVVTKSKSPIRRQLTRNPLSRTSNSPPRVNVVQVPVVSVAQGKQGTWVWRPKCPILDHDF
nr:hypothetical protein [Tanacetum cinerariifolium]